MAVRPLETSVLSHASNLEWNRAEQEDPTRPETEPRDGRPLKRLSVPQVSGETALANSVDLAAPAQRPSSFSILPIPRAASEKHTDVVPGREPATLNHVTTHDASSRIGTNADASSVIEQPGPVQEVTQVIDLTHDNGQKRQMESTSNIILEDDSATNVGSAREGGLPSSSDPGQRTPEATTGGLESAERASRTPKTPLQFVKQGRVNKRIPVLQQQPSSVPSRGSGHSTARAPSEEDLYFLLLHRYRKREQTERQLTARLRQLETENVKLDQAAQECQKQLQTSTALSSKQAVEVRSQKLVIRDIQNAYSKIKKFMTDVYNDQMVLQAKAASIDQDRQALRDEHGYIQDAIAEAKEATLLSSNAMRKMKNDLANCRQDAAHLETSIKGAELELRKEQRLLAQERQRNTRYENHIADVTRKQNSFSLTIQQEQQHVLNALRSIKDTLSELKTDHVVAALPQHLPALDQCVGMLTALTKVETASRADVTDMIQVVQALTERYALPSLTASRSLID